MLRKYKKWKNCDNSEYPGSFLRFQITWYSNLVKYIVKHRELNGQRIPVLTMLDYDRLLPVRFSSIPGRFSTDLCVAHVTNKST